MRSSTMAALTALGLALGVAPIGPDPAAAQQAPPAAHALPPPTGLAAEIMAYENLDISGDPKGHYAKLMALKARAEADPNLSPLYLGKLHTAIAGTFFYRDDYAGALEWLAKATGFYERGHAPADMIAENLGNRGAILGGLGRFDEAEGLIRRAVALRTEIFGDRSLDVAESTYQLASILRAQGRIEEATTLFRKAADLQDELSPENYPRRVLRLTALAAILNESGRTPEAIATGYRTEQLARETLPEDHQLYGVALNNLASNLNSAGRYAEALPLLQRSLEVRLKSQPEDSPQVGVSLRNLSYALQGLGRDDEALAVLERAIPIFEKASVGMEATGLSTVYGARASLAAQRRDWDAYDLFIGKAIAAADAVLPEASPDRAYVHVSHADMLGQRGHSAEGLAIAEKWVPVMQAGLQPGHRNRIWSAAVLARLRAEAGGDAATVRPLAEETIAALRTRLGDLGLTATDAARAAETNRNAALALFAAGRALGDDGVAFEALQLASLTDLSVALAASADRAGPDGGAEAMRAAIVAAARRRNELERRKALALNGGQSAAVADLEAQLAATDADLRAAEQRLDREFPGYSARYRPRPTSLEAARAALGPHDVLFAPVEGPAEAWSVLVTRERIDIVPVDRLRLRALVTRLRAAVDGGADQAFPLDAASDLYALLFPRGIAPGTRLLMHGGHDLASLPLALLLTRPFEGDLARAPWLARTASVAVVPDLSALVASAGRGSGGRASQGFAGIGGAELPSEGKDVARVAALFRSGAPAAETIADLPPLPDAADELRAIAQALPGEDVVLVGPDAREERLKATDLSTAKVLAFATHGLVSGELKGLWEPALLLGTAAGSGEDGLLGASEIARLRLDADWVILSACNTAAGGADGAPLYSGLAAAFAQAGARGLMLSHWRVRDDAAARLTVETVKGAAKGMERAEALRRAQVALLADRKVPGAAHPAVWAPFVIVE